ncbi:MAG: glutathione S-transferase N-terminal domain-containing protein [Brevundimonas sp.]|uniref:glutathione S-transferase N-terminal domain-containing protein n=1 Tax=Brevundimonas sp. TaxID=1871086 RepID=UPI0027340E71|nr:glutathione S-transferase N-terminal domain-containing protein [Brevundimonas sp.]MDP3403460.1 glutathione S-transferase N-terminal domain-containing protein [Brevundimonas sp.]
MLELFCDGAPNAWKTTIMLQECALAYRARRIDLQAGEQFTPDVPAISPNGNIPVLVDQPSASDAPLTIAGSGAILLYLAESTGDFRR